MPICTHQVSYFWCVFGERLYLDVRKHRFRLLIEVKLIYLICVFPLTKVKLNKCERHAPLEVMIFQAVQLSQVSLLVAVADPDL